MRTEAQLSDHRLDQIFNDLRRELAAAIMKHAPMHSAHEGHSVIREELEELWEHVREDTGHTARARKEALQVAAMGIRYAYDLCKDAPNGGLLLQETIRSAEARHDEGDH